MGGCSRYRKNGNGYIVEKPELLESILEEKRRNIEIFPDTIKVELLEDGQYKISYRRTWKVSDEREFSTLNEVKQEAEKIRNTEGVEKHTVIVKTRKPLKAKNLWLCKKIRDEILNGKQVFPMYLP